MKSSPDIHEIDAPEAFAAPDRFARLLKVVTGCAVVLLVLTAAFALPAKWGGQMSYLNLEGVSMQPLLHSKDLAIVRQSSTYKVGDIAAYKPVGSHGAFYLHRITKISSDGYTFKGDNNKDADARTIKKEQLIGKMLIHIPRAGALITSRLFLIVVAGMILLLTYGVSMLPDRFQPIPALGRLRLRMHEGIESIKGPEPIKWSMFLVSIALLIAASSMWLARPHQAKSAQVHANLTYAADATKGDTYPDGKIHSGDTIYTRLTHKLDMTWQLDGARARGLKLYLKDGQDWQREIPMDGSWTNGIYHASVDIDQIAKLTDKIQQQTTVANSTWTLQFKADHVRAGAPSIPGYNFQMEAGVLRPTDKDSLTWTPNVMPGHHGSSALWIVMIAAAGIAFLILGIMDNQPSPRARRVMLTGRPVGDWLEIDSAEEIEAMAIKLDVPVMEHASGLYVMGAGMTRGYHYSPECHVALSHLKDADSEVA